jgi:hypothetical protein
MKVVINTCFGGYTLSELAVKRYVELKGLKFFTDEGDDGTTKYYTIEVEKYKEELAEENRLFKEKSEKYHGHPSNRHCWNPDYQIERDDPVLVQVVEDLGSKANGDCAKLLVVAIPDDVEYFIDDYDGKERIHEAHRSWP